MSALLARLGQSQARNTAHSLRTTGTITPRNENVCVECRANFSQTLSQSRSCGDDTRSLDSGKRKRQEARPSSTTLRLTSLGQTLQQRGIHKRAPAAAASEKSAYDIDPDSSSPPDPAHNPRPSTRANRNARELDKVAPLTDSEQLELCEQPERDDGTEEAVVIGEKRRDVFVKADKMLDIDYKVELSIALLKHEADMVIRCLFAALHVNDHDFIRNIPATTFSEIIRVLEPRHFMSPLASAHLQLSGAMARQLGIAPMRKIAYEYASVLQEVFSLRRGIRLTLSDFKVLLRSARDLGNLKFARKLWEFLWSEGHTPDTTCYNLYMSSVVWNGVHSAGARQKVRVIDSNMIARRKERPKNNFRQYRVGAEGVREVVVSIFNEMLSNDAVANEESFRILITAAAREGAVATVKSILRNVWRIDVDALIAGEEECNITPKFVPTHSPLHPTPQLLFVIAHAFGINNDIPSALRVVDFVARSYQIPITRVVWSQLFEWTFVLSLERHGTDKATGSTTGQLPSKSAMSLWDTMVSAPYHVQPTMGMYNLLIKNLFQRNLTPNIVEKMREARELYFRHRLHTQELWSALQSRVKAGRDLERDSVEKLRHEYEAAELMRTRYRLWLKRWLRLLLATYRDAHRVEATRKSYAEDLPALLWEWRMLAPTVVKYETQTGFVTFKIRTDAEIERAARDRFLHKKEIRRQLGEVQRYVGEQWTRGEARPTNRLKESEVEMSIEP